MMSENVVIFGLALFGVGIIFGVLLPTVAG